MQKLKNMSWHLNTHFTSSEPSCMPSSVRNKLTLKTDTFSKHSPTEFIPTSHRHMKHLHNSHAEFTHDANLQVQVS
jgi:hypothetical protein